MGETASVSQLDAKRRHGRDMLAELLARDLGDSVIGVDVQEIMVNSPRSIWVERAGQMHHLKTQIPGSRIDGMIRLLASHANKVIGASGTSAIVDAEFQGMRAVAISDSVAPNGPCFCIRRHDDAPWSLDEYLERGMFDVDPHSVAASLAADERFDRNRVREGGQRLRELIDWAFRTKRSILVSGDTSSGKTKFLRAAAFAIPEADRVVTLEDTRELNLQHPNLVELVSNRDIGITLRTLVATAMRLRPDRVVVGEVRGEEAYDLLAIMNTGHPCMATIHANGAIDALARLETLVMMSQTQMPSEVIRRQLAATVSLVFHFSKYQGRRELREIIEVSGYEGNKYQYQSLFRKEGISP